MVISIDSLRTLVYNTITVYFTKWLFYQQEGDTYE